MTIQKIKSGRVLNVEAANFVGERGSIFYDEYTGELRLSNGETPGGILITTGGSPGPLAIASTSTLGGIKVGPDFTINPDGTLFINQDLYYTSAEVDRAITASLAVDFGFISDSLVELVEDYGFINEPVV